jgi:RNA polymerase sigma-70 factor (ECF subfamily)
VQTTVDEAELVRRCRQGDLKSAEQLFRTYHRPIHNLVGRMLHERGEVEDLVQEVFLRAFGSIGGFREEASFKTWLMRIATNTCLNFIEKSKRQGIESLDDPLDSGDSRGDLLVGRGSPEGDLLADEMGARLQEAIDRLSPDFRAVLVLRDVQGLTYEEVAQAVGVNLGTVKSRLARARALCVTWMKEYLS